MYGFSRPSGSATSRAKTVICSPSGRAWSSGTLTSCSTSTRPGAWTTVLLCSLMATILAPDAAGLPASAGEQAAGSAQTSEEVVELLVALHHAGLHAAGQDRVAVLDRLRHRAPGEAGAPVAEVLERQRLQRDLVRHPVEREGLH